MSDSAWKGHVINALRMAGYSSVHIKKIMKNLEKSLEVLPEEQAEDLFSKTNTQ